MELLHRISIVLGVPYDEIFGVWSKGNRYMAKYGKDDPARNLRNPFTIYLRRHVFDRDEDEAA